MILLIFQLLGNNVLSREKQEKLISVQIFEKLKKYKIRYEGYHDTTCLIELDEEPIMPINQEALFRTLAISKIFLN